MKPVNQTLFGDGNGNCFTACVASILELPIEAVPNFCADSKGKTMDMWDMVAEWVRSQNYGLVHIPIKLANCFWVGMDNCWGIGTVPSQKIPDCDHGVIIGWRASGRWCNPYIAHDPNPNNEREYEIKEITAVEFLIPRCKSDHPEECLTP